MTRVGYQPLVMASRRQFSWKVVVWAGGCLQGPPRNSLAFGDWRVGESDRQLPRGERPESSGKEKDC